MSSLTDIVIPFDVAKSLKERKVPQHNSCFAWWELPYRPNDPWLGSADDPVRDGKNSHPNGYAAFTLQELGDLLPIIINKNNKSYYLYISKYYYDGVINYICDYRYDYPDYNTGKPEYLSDTEYLSDHDPVNHSELLARANMLIWLIDNGYLKFGEGV